MAETPGTQPSYGLVATLDELLAARPADGVGGFAPGGKVRTHQFGGHRSAFRGRGMEFDEVRAYQPGDDIRTIDWRVTARTGRTHTKLFQEERERPVLLLVDARAGMRFGTRDCFKSVLAARAAALLTWVAIAGGDRVGGVVLTPSGLSAYRPERSRRRILHFVKAVADATAEGFGREDAAPDSPSLATALAHLRSAARPGTLVFLLTDFADFDGAAARELNRLAHSSQVTALFTYDALEARLPARGAYRISDGEGVAHLDTSTPAMTAYAERFALRRGRIEQFCRQHGMAFVPLHTGQDASDILHPERLTPARAGRRAVA